MKQASFHCPRCKQHRLFQSEELNHVAHLIASIFLCGLWLPVWLILAVFERPIWRCSFCGSSPVTAKAAITPVQPQQPDYNYKKIPNR